MVIMASTGGVRIAIGKLCCTWRSKHQILTGLKLRRPDRGGTFTDVWASLPGQPDVVLKLLSVDPSNYADAPTEGSILIWRALANENALTQF